MEVARRVIGNLTATPPECSSVTVLPSLFPRSFALAEREARSRGGAFDPERSPDPDDGRTTLLPSGAERDPNRNFPPIGQCYLTSGRKDQFGYDIADENVFLQDLIADERPAAIISVHAIKVVAPVTPDLRDRTSLPGIFVDPPTELPAQLTRDSPGTMPPISSADPLALSAARFIRSRQQRLLREHEPDSQGVDLSADWVSGNWLDSGAPTARYARQRDMDTGISLGEWASRPVTKTPRSSQRRAGILVVTVEVRRYYCSADVAEHEKRAAELQAHADAITEVMLPGLPEAVDRVRES